MRNITFAILILAVCVLFIFHFVERKNIDIVEEGYTLLEDTYFFQDNGEIDFIEEKKQPLEIITVAAETSPCIGVAPMDCMIVNGSLFYDTIHGFDFEPGYEYSLAVEKILREEPIPADASSWYYELHEILQKKEKIEESPINL